MRIVLHRHRPCPCAGLFVVIEETYGSNLVLHSELSAIADRILGTATAALKAANTQLVFRGPGIEHYQDIALVTTALAGELFLKAIVAKIHPLLIFKDLFNLDDPSDSEITISSAILKGRTYSFEQMGRVLWVVAGERLPDPKSYKDLIVSRNAIQHFCAPIEDMTEIGLRFFI